MTRSNFFFLFMGTRYIPVIWGDDKVLITAPRVIVACALNGHIARLEAYCNILRRQKYQDLGS